MTTQGNVKGLDELGNQVLWSSLGQQVMMQWEKNYMHVTVDALRILSTDRVLEIGFGLAYSASHIQSFKPKSHTIIECDQETLQRAREFADVHEGVKIVSGVWQQTLHTLDTFDCVFFDDYPLPELLTDSVDFSRSCNRQRSRWHEFLDVALRHCAPGARISGYLARELDLQRPGCNVSVKQVQVDVPSNCNYFPHKTALVPVITVVDPVAAGGCKIDVEKLVLPQTSKKFLRAFENANKSKRTKSGFVRERDQIEEIRGFLLAHEMDALSHDQSGDDINYEGHAQHDVGCEVSFCEESGEGQEDAGSIHYRDELSRREFLRVLRKKACSTKQMCG